MGRCIICSKDTTVSCSECSTFCCFGKCSQSDKFKNHVGLHTLQRLTTPAGTAPVFTGMKYDGTVQIMLVKPPDARIVFRNIMTPLQAAFMKRGMTVEIFETYDADGVAPVGRNPDLVCLLVSTVAVPKLSLQDETFLEILNKRYSNVVVVFTKLDVASNFLTNYDFDVESGYSGKRKRVYMIGINFDASKINDVGATTVYLDRWVEDLQWASQSGLFEITSPPEQVQDNSELEKIKQRLDALEKRFRDLEEKSYR